MGDPSAELSREEIQAAVDKVNAQAAEAVECEGGMGRVGVEELRELGGRGEGEGGGRGEEGGGR